MSETLNFGTTLESTLHSPTAEWLRGGEVRGEFLKTHLSWVEQYHGVMGLQKVRDRLPPALAMAIEDIRPAWLYPFEWLVTLDRAIERKFGRGKKTFHQELGRFSAYLELADSCPSPSGQGLHDVFRELAMQHRFRQDFGSVAYEQADERAGRLVHTELVCFSPVFCANKLGYYEQIVTMNGGRRPRIEESACVCRGGDRCVFELRWS